MKAVDLMLDLDVAEADTRRCYRCGEVRPIAMFYVALEKRRAVREGRSHFRWQCRLCQREANMARIKPRQDYLDAIKLTSGCTDCGLKIPHPEIYDFDHLPGCDKVMPLSKFLTKGTFEDLVAEVAKCEVVCANCHRIRSRSRDYVSFGRDQSRKL